MSAARRFSGPDHVSVDARGDRRICMTEASGDDAHRHAGEQERGCVDVAEVVQPGNVAAVRPGGPFVALDQDGDERADGVRGLLWRVVPTGIKWRRRTPPTALRRPPPGRAA